MHSHYSTCSPMSRQAESCPSDPKESCCKASGFAWIHTAGCEPSTMEGRHGHGRGAATRTLVCSDLHRGLRKLAPVFVLSFLLTMLCLHLTTDGTQNDGAPGAAGCCQSSSVTKTTTASNHPFDLLDCFFCFLTFSQFYQGFLPTKTVIS